MPTKWKSGVRVFLMALAVFVVFGALDEPVSARPAPNKWVSSLP